MYVVFVTGGLASGKKTVCDLLAEAGATVLDLDAIAKAEQEDSNIQEQICAAFGRDLITDEGELNRKLLAQRAFATPEDAARLNAICWPPTMERLADLLVGGSCQLRGGSELVVVEIPLLAESGAGRDLADEVLCVVADEDIRRQRARQRGMAATDIENRLALQASDEERLAISDGVIDNNGTLEQLKYQVNDWLAAYQTMRNQLTLP